MDSGFTSWLRDRLLFLVLLPILIPVLPLFPILIQPLTPYLIRNLIRSLRHPSPTLSRA